MSRQDSASRSSRGTAFFATVLLLVLGLPAVATAAEVTIAVVRDGAGPEARLAESIERELANHTPRGTTVRFKADPAFDAGWSYDNAAGALQAAFDDAEVDLVLAVGSLVTEAAGRSAGPLTKPVVSTFVQRADIFAMPYSDDGESLRHNLSFIVIPQRAGADVRAFLEIVHFDTLHVAVTAEDLIDEAELKDGLARYEEDLGISFEVVPVTTDVAKTVADLSGAGAVYLTRLQRFTAGQRQALIDGLNAAGVPTFSMLGHPDVEIGALAGVTPDIESQVVRRVALNLGRLMRGKPASELPVLLSVDTRLKVNARTANAIGFSPGREARIFAEFVHAEELETDAEALDFETLFSLAESGSRLLQVSDTEVEGVKLDADLAKSGLLPQVSANVNYTHADTDVTDSEQAAFGSLVLRQQIFDDEIRSAYKASNKIADSAELERETDRLDVLAGAGQAFYSLASAQAQYRIVAGDLRLTEDNLELAKLRKDVGYSGRDEVLRWESVLAERRTALFRAAEAVEETRIALNQVLGVDLASRWIPDPPEIDPDVFPVFGGRLAEFFNDTSRVDQTRRGIVELALENAPELASFDRAIEAQQIQVGQFKRRYTVPRVFAELAYSDQITSPEGPIFAEDDTYSVSVNAAYPIFEGGRRKAQLGRARSDEEALTRRRELVRERLEQRIRTAMRRCESSFPRIKFGIQSAGTAGESLELVQEQYAEGTVNVTDLLAAQNQKLTADQFASTAIYEFMGDLVELQRAIAWFEIDHTPEERDAFVMRILSATSEEQP